MRAASAGAEKSRARLGGGAREALGEGVHARLEARCGTVGGRPRLAGSSALAVALVSDRAGEGALFLCELLVFGGDLIGGETSFSSRTVPCTTEGEVVDGLSCCT